MKLLNIIKNNLFIQNFVASIVSLIPSYFEFSVAKYLAIKKAMLITAHDNTRGSYLEFGVFTGSSFNFAMKVNKQIEKLGYGDMDCEFIGFDSFKGFGDVKKNDEETVDEVTIIKNKFRQTGYDKVEFLILQAEGHILIEYIIPLFYSIIKL